MKFIAAVLLAATVSGCAADPATHAIDDRPVQTAAPDLRAMLKEGVSAYCGPGEYLAFRDTLPHQVLPYGALGKPENVEFLRAHREQAIPILLELLREGNHAAGFFLAFLHAKEALPLLREKLLQERYFYGWEGPDYSTEAAYMDETQYPRLMAYVVAMEIIGGVLPYAVQLTDQERIALEAEAALANPRAANATDHYAAKFLLSLLSVLDPVPPRVQEEWRWNGSYYALLEIVEAHLDPTHHTSVTKYQVRERLGDPIEDPEEYPNAGPNDWVYASWRHVPWGPYLIFHFDQAGIVQSMEWASE